LIAEYRAVESRPVVSDAGAQHLHGGPVDAGRLVAGEVGHLQVADHRALRDDSVQQGAVRH
jgi:hypothetical protein